MPFHVTRHCFLSLFQDKKACAEAALNELLKLLEDYRRALEVSKPRPSTDLDPAEVISGYYRLSEPMADSLGRQLPMLIEPETWSAANPNQPGSISAISTESSSVDAKGNPVPQVVLVIRQTRAVHQLIGKFIETLLASKSIDPSAGLGSRRDNSQMGTFGRNLMHAPKK